MWTAPFRIPRPWEADAPALTTDRSEHLLDFLDQVDMIIELGHVADEQERKNLLTSYLPVTKHLLWREMKIISDGNSCHPEIAERTRGSLEGLDELCKSFGKISRSSAGILRRFSMQFCALVERLQRPPALLTNQDAHWTTSSHSVYKERLGSGKLCAFCFGSLESRHKENFERKEDLIQLQDLVEIVDTIAAVNTAYLMDPRDESHAPRYILDGSGQKQCGRSSNPPPSNIEILWGMTRTEVEGRSTRMGWMVVKEACGTPSQIRVTISSLTPYTFREAWVELYVVDYTG
ncbi:hypothetical protein DFH08DRAFT_817801 [Mycena albidolilacea]|uniref:Uncharacterized protein n=1 Tax=Mycena albidolilacea TaxID=1033008 RepID=A0AAD6ZHE8_9AGAR|nr:hypothetical protein DFH08DRAFT_817801 [Mycena albidolilacea]